MSTIITVVLEIVATMVTIASIIFSYVQIKLSLQITKKWDIAVSKKLPLPTLFFLRSSFWMKTSLKKIIMSHLYYARERFDAGTYDHVFIQFYVDLMEAAVISKELKIMALNLIRIIRENVNYEFTTITVPKNGCPLLGYEVARKMNKKLLMIKDYGPRREYKFDGKFTEKDVAIIIDDVSSDGLFLVKPIDILHENKICSKDCFVIVHRKEGDAKHKLGDKGHKLYSIFELSDEDIANLIGVNIL